MRNGGSKAWLDANGWRLDSATESTVSTGIPNGPYTGPVYTRQFPAGRIPVRHSRLRPPAHSAPSPGARSAAVRTSELTRVRAPPAGLLPSPQLNGSDNWEGTYFVFLELHSPSPATAA